MKRMVTTCDICGKDITVVSDRYKFKHYHSGYENYGDWEFEKWSKRDMCEDCYTHLINFIEKERTENEQIYRQR